MYAALCNNYIIIIISIMIVIIILIIPVNINQVSNPLSAICNNDDYNRSTRLLAATTLR